MLREELIHIIRCFYDPAKTADYIIEKYDIKEKGE